MVSHLPACSFVSPSYYQTAYYWFTVFIRRTITICPAAVGYGFKPSAICAGRMNHHVDSDSRRNIRRLVVRPRKICATQLPPGIVQDRWIRCRTRRRCVVVAMMSRLLPQLMRFRFALPRAPFRFIGYFRAIRPDAATWNDHALVQAVTCHRQQYPFVCLTSPSTAVRYGQRLPPLHFVRFCWNGNPTKRLMLTLL